LRLLDEDEETGGGGSGIPKNWAAVGWIDAFTQPGTAAAALLVRSEDGGGGTARTLLLDPDQGRNLQFWWVVRDE
jgi:hypothetical protein